MNQLNSARPVSTVSSFSPGQAARQRIAARVPQHSAGTVQLTSEELFAGAAEVQIAHEGALYRLKRTALGKLIMTK